LPIQIIAVVRRCDILEDNHVKGYIPNHGGYKAEREGFTYDKKNDWYMCRRGKQLRYLRTYVENTGYTKKEYRSSEKDCKDCPLRSQCIGKSAYKRITDSIDKPLYDRMHERMQSAKARRMMKLRQSTAEPVLGILVNFLGMRRVNTIGIEQAGKCMLMAATAYNLKKLLRFRAPKVNVAIQKMKKVKEAIQKSIFSMLWTIHWMNNRNMKMAIQLSS